MTNSIKLLIICLAITSAFSADATVIHVDVNATGSNTGNNWTNAFVDLQDALAVAVSGDEIWIAQGVYKPTATADRTIYFQVPDGVDLYGGFNGTEIQRSQRDWGAYKTRLSGAIGDLNDITDNSYCLIYVQNASVEGVRIDGITLQRVYSDLDTDPVDITGAIYVENAQVNARHCEFRWNVSRVGAATKTLGFCGLDACVINLNNCLLRDNHTTEGGLVYYQGGATGVVRGCTFSQNIIDEDFGRVVGAWVDATPEVYNSIFWDNGTNDVFTPPVVADHCIADHYTPHANFTNMISGDPHFKDPGSNDFTLTSLSPAIDAGDNAASNLLYDFIQNPRIWNGTVDMGCFEYFTEDIIYVDQSASGANDGSSWQNAFVDLQDGLAAFAADEQIWVAEGIYTPTSGTDRTIAFDLPADITLYGGFAGTESDVSMRDWLTNFSVLSGNIGLADASDNSHHVVLADADGDITIDGFRIEDGTADGAGFDANGAGLKITQTSAYITNCAFRNHIGIFGSAIMAYGGGVDLTLDNCLFEENSGNADPCISVGTGDVLLCSNSTFRDNEAYVNIGAVAGLEATIELYNCDFTNNVSPDIGAVSLYIGTLIIQDCLFDSNIAEDQTSAVYAWGADVTIDRCVFTNNDCERFGAITCQSAVMAISNCLFDGNIAQDESCVYTSFSGQTFIMNCTFHDNGMFIGASSRCVNTLSGSNTQMTNSIFWNNHVIDSYGDGTNSSTFNCIVEGGGPGTNIIDLDPEFIDPLNEDFHFTSNSPAFDAGDNIFSLQSLDLDLNDRIFNGTVDLGCFETQEIAVGCLGDYDHDGLVATSDLLYFLGQFGCVSGCDADITGDDAVTTNDLLLFLTLFGNPC